MRKTTITAAAVAVAAGTWLLSGYLDAGQSVDIAPSLEELNAQARATSGTKAPTVVRGRVIHAERYPARVKVRGHTENKRTVQVRAETGGRVVERPVERGDQVASGDLLCRIAVEDRQARLTEAHAATNQALMEHRGSLRLKDQGFQSETAIAQAKARLASAQARLKAAALDIERTQVRAPFAGVVEETLLEVGDFAQAGTPCASIVDLDPMLLVGRVSEADVYRIAAGAAADGHLANGQTVQGRISFVGQQAAADTRTYRVEVTVANADYRLRSGVTAEINIVVDEVLAHRISPAVLALDDAGRIGVRTVGDDRRVRFDIVEIVADAADGVWVTGLPNPATLITVGHQLVVAGEPVLVQFEHGETPRSATEQPQTRPQPQETNIAAEDRRNIARSS
jgi:multidrug efflux system membrane fusion protein